MITAPTFDPLDDQREAGADALAVAREFLMQRFITAMNRDPAERIPAPGYFLPDCPLEQIINDAFCAKSGTGSLIELLRIVALLGCADTQEEFDANVLQARLRAQAWVAKAAKDYADFHADDMSYSMQEG